MNTWTRSWLLLAALSLTLIVFGHYYFGREGLLLTLMIVLGMNTYIYFYEDLRLAKLVGGYRIEGQDSYELQDMAKRLAVRARLPTPQIIILPIATPQSAVLGRTPQQGKILITQGALDRFSKPELEAILSWQMAGLLTHSTFAFSVASFIVTTVLLLTETLDAVLRVLIVEKRNPKVPISQVFTRLAAPIAGGLLRVFVRPKFYQQTDQMAAQLLGDRERISQVLWKLDSYAKTLPMRVSLSTAHTFTVSPLTRHRWTHFFVTQPKTNQRIDQLIFSNPKS